MAYPRFQRARSFKFLRRTQNASAGSDYSIGSTTWTLLDSTNLVLSLNAQVGDVLEVQLHAVLVSPAVMNSYALLDVVTLNASAAVNYFSSGSGTPGNNGMPAWPSGNPNSATAVALGVGSPAYYTLQVADIVNGKATVTLAAKNTSTGTGSLRASSSNPLFFAAKNLGPVDPT